MFIFLYEHTQRGAALVMAMLITLALMIVGVSAARGALHGEKSARAERDRGIAFEAAEAALRDAERDIEGGNRPDSARAGLFSHRNASAFTVECGAAPAANVGLCQMTAAPAPPAWQRVALAGATGPRRSVEFGQFTGATMRTGAASSARLPHYVIELIPLTRVGEDAARPPGNFYRITAIGFGATDSTHVVLQTYYLKSLPGEGT